MTLRRALTLAVISVVIPAMVYASPVQAEASGSWLLNKVAEAAEKRSQSAKRSGRQADAQTWQDWAALYRVGARSFVDAKIPALQLLARNIEFCRDRASYMEKSRAFQAMKFYNASVLLWEDLAKQVRRGGEIRINFPDREMLTPVPGIPGTPWEFLRVSPTAPSGQASGEECRQLYKEWRRCDEEYEALRKSSPSSPDTLMRNFNCINLKYGFTRRCKP